VAEDGEVRTFTGQPQPVEIHHRGIWYSGELLGWKHDSEGWVVARVRCVVDRLRHSAWKDLADLRLPDPANPPRREPARVPAQATVATAPDEADATRPHVLLAGLRTRPRSPEHVRTPPPRSSQPVERPPWDPVDRPAAATSPVRPRAGVHPERRKAYLSAV
jgi:hypothetical protein